MNIFTILTSLLLISAAQAQTRPVSYVDLNRYLGDWYEIASIPQIFSKDCNCTRAQYSLNSNGTISVFNTCNKKSVDGSLSKAKGEAKVVDKVSNAKLKVSFFKPFYGDYWIIGLDTEYRYAVVSNEDGSTLWILSRTPILEQTLLDEALRTAEENSVDTSKLLYNTQTGCNYPKN